MWHVNAGGKRKNDEENSGDDELHHRQRNEERGQTGHFFRQDMTVDNIRNSYEYRRAQSGTNPEQSIHQSLYI